MSSRPHCPLTVVVGDEHGLLKHIHVPSVFAPAPRKPDRLRAAPRELGEAGPRATLDPTLVLQYKAEFAAWKAQVRSSSCPSFWFCFFLVVLLLVVRLLLLFLRFLLFLLLLVSFHFL